MSCLESQRILFLSLLDPIGLTNVIGTPIPSCFFWMRCELRISSWMGGQQSLWVSTSSCPGAPVRKHRVGEKASCLHSNRPGLNPRATVEYLCDLGPVPGPIQVSVVSCGSSEGNNITATEWWRWREDTHKGPSIHSVLAYLALKTFHHRDRPQTTCAHTRSM